LAGGAEGDLKGFAGSPVQRKARLGPSPVSRLNLPGAAGEVLVCPSSVLVAFPGLPFSIAAVVTDIGDMSHAAIVCRGNGLPAVVGTGFARKQSRPVKRYGLMVRWDGNCLD
jgi:pyruvate,water dikinase